MYFDGDVRSYCPCHAPPTSRCVEAPEEFLASIVHVCLKFICRPSQIDANAPIKRNFALIFILFAIFFILFARPLPCYLYLSLSLSLVRSLATVPRAQADKFMPTSPIFIDAFTCLAKNHLRN